MPKQHGKPVPGYDDELGTRIATVIRTLGGLKKAAPFAGITDESLAAWRDGRTEARFLGLYGLARAAGVSLDWLATGKESGNKNDPGAEYRDSGPLTSVSIDVGLLQDVIRMTEDRLAAQKRYLTPAKKALLISEVYAFVASQEESKRPQSDVDRLVAGMLKVVE